MNADDVNVNVRAVNMNAEPVNVNVRAMNRKAGPVGVNAGPVRVNADAADMNVGGTDIATVDGESQRSETAESERKTPVPGTFRAFCGYY
jgi:hypothetical protein